MGVESAGLLLYRRRDDAIEVLIAHPGGPFFARRHEGVWSLPKGLLENGESPVEAAEREFAEETGFAVPEGERVSLGQVRMRSGKVVHGWAVRGDADPGALDPGTFLLEWPPGSGRMVDTPEIDEVRWVTPDQALVLLQVDQRRFVTRLLKIVAHQPDLDHTQ